MARKPMKFRNDIQGLRSIAVLFVFFFHLSNTFLPGGFVGVDIFFVISGFLVSKIVYTKIQNSDFSIRNFYISRIKRIVPAYLFLLLIITIPVFFIFITSDLKAYKSTLIWTLIFASNHHFALLDNYFGATSTENPLLHTWTLAVEMQFYLLLPVALLLVKKKKYLLILLATLTVALLIYSTYAINDGQASQMYYSLYSRIPEFTLGMLGAILNLENNHFIVKNKNTIAIIGLVGLFISSIIYTELTPFPGVTVLPPCIGALLILITPGSKINNILSTPVFRFIGEISYSIYLWHWPIMSLMRYYNNSYSFSAAQTAIVVILTLVFSLFSYYIIEKPLRRKSSKSTIRRIGLMGAVVLAQIIFIIKLKAQNNKLPGYYTPYLGLNSHGATFKKVERFGDTSVPTKQRILLIGDSHALCMKNYLNIIGKTYGFSFKTVTNNTYPTIPGLTRNEIKNKTLYFQYEHLIEITIKEIADADLIIVQFEGNGSPWRIPLENLIKHLKPRQKLLLFTDFPRLDKNPIRINRGISKNNEIHQNYQIESSPLDTAIVRLFDGNPNCKIVDYSNEAIFKNGPFYNDTLMYYDQGHLNIYGTRIYAKKTAACFMKTFKSLID